jgi:ligand-binding sensor domain-containing protein
LFTAADTLQNHSLYNSVAPTDTLQAVYNIAQHPVTTYGYQVDMGSLAGLSTVNSPFQPTLTGKPNDWSISLHYTGGGLTTGSTVGSFAVDATGNLWITDPASRSVIEWNSVGAAITPSTGFSAGGGPVAIDATGNIWISGDGVLTELTSLGNQFPGSPFGGVSGGGGDVAIDAQGNLWITDGSGVAEFNSLGSEISPSGGYVLSGITGVAAVGIDSSNNVWAGFNQLSNPGG